MPVRVAYFSNQFADRAGHGLARYARDLHGAIAATGRVDITPVSAWSSLPSDHLWELKQDTNLRVLPTGRRGTSVAWTFLHLPPLEWMMGGRIDITHAVTLGYPICTHKPLVVTIHDLGPLVYPEFFRNTRPWVFQRALDQAVSQAAAIVCISNATANDVRARCGTLVEDRLHVIHSGVSEQFFTEPDHAVLEDFNLPPPGTPFILSAGKLSPRKNVTALLRALKLARDDIPHHLILAGGEGWDTTSVREEMNATSMADRVHLLDYVPDEALRSLYRRADVYVHASLFEGFGQTVLEAMASGTPVITSNVSSLPEVAGGAALLVDPRDIEEIAAALVNVCSDAKLAGRLRKAGLVRAREFTWANTAQKMLRVYEGVLSR